MSCFQIQTVGVSSPVHLNHLFCPWISQLLVRMGDEDGEGDWLLNLFLPFSWQEDGDSSCQLSLGAFLDPKCVFSAFPDWLYFLGSRSCGGMQETSKFSGTRAMWMQLYHCWAKLDIQLHCIMWLYEPVSPPAHESLFLICFLVSARTSLQMCELRGPAPDGCSSLSYHFKHWLFSCDWQGAQQPYGKGHIAQCWILFTDSIWSHIWVLNPPNFWMD